MKRKTLLLLLLFLPYLIWLAAIPFIGLPFDSVLHTLTAGFSIVYTFGIIFWGIPYTTLVIGLSFWSKNKSAKELYDVLAQSPLLLAWITLAEFLLVYLSVGLFGSLTGLTSGSQLSLLELAGGFFSIIAYALMAMFGIFIYG